jgi:hypothetical protein
MKYLVLLAFQPSLDLFAYRCYCPIEVLKKMPSGEVRVGGSRYTSQTKNNSAFSSIISSDSRYIVGTNVEDLLEQPYIKCWLPVYASMYTDLSGVVDEKKRLNIARHFFHNALAVQINALDSAVMIKPRSLSPQPDNGNPNFTDGQLRSDPPVLSFPWLVQLYPAETSSICAGSCTVNCTTLHDALVALGVESFSILCNGGNKKLHEVLNPRDPNMQIWILFAR